MAKLHPEGNIQPLGTLPASQLIRQESSGISSVVLDIEPPTLESGQPGVTNSFQSKRLEALLGSSYQLAFCVSKKGTLAEVYDDRGEPMMHGKVTRETSVAYTANNQPHIVEFIDNDGNALFTCIEKDKQIDVKAGNQIFGHIEKKGLSGVTSFCELQGLQSNVIVSIVGSGSFFNFFSNGTLTATAGVDYGEMIRSGNSEVKLTFSTSLEATTKVMVIAASYYSVRNIGADVVKPTERRCCSSLSCCCCCKWMLLAAVAVLLLPLLPFAFDIVCISFVGLWKLGRRWQLFGPQQSKTTPTDGSIISRVNE